MSIKFHKEGYFTRQYTPSSALVAGDPVDIGDGVIGVAKVDVPANTVGEFYIRGLFNVTKATGFTHAVGANVLYDTVNKQAVSAYTDDCIIIGRCTVASVSADTTVQTELNAGQNTGAGLSDDFESLDDSAPAINTRGVTYLDGTSNTVSATLANGEVPGQMKLVTCINADNAVTLSVATHKTSSPEVFTFAVTQPLLLIWDGVTWVTVTTVTTAAA